MAINYQGIGWNSTNTFLSPTNLNAMDNATKAACDGVDTLNNYLTTNTINYTVESEPTRFMNCVFGSVDITSNSYFGDVQFILKVQALAAYTDYNLAYSTIHPKQQCTMFIQSDGGKRIKVVLYTDGRLFATPIDSIEENEFIVCHFTFAI